MIAVSANPFRSYSTELRKRFGAPVQKLSVNAGLRCPNRDGTLDTRGCTYCNNEAFSPAYCSENLSIAEQIRRGMEFFRRKGPERVYFAYFQTFSNTYASLDRLKSLYEQALSVSGVSGILIGTRPDCVNEEVLDYLAQLSSRTYVGLEYGVESTLDRTLERINRHCDYETAVRSICMTHDRGMAVGVHLILGLPGEELCDMLHHAEALSALPLHSLKLHQLQIVRDTAMESEYMRDPSSFRLFDIEEYIDLLVNFLERLNPAIAIDRLAGQVPPAKLIAPVWGVRNHEISLLVKRAMLQRGTYQGRRFTGESASG